MQFAIKIWRNGEKYIPKTRSIYLLEQYYKIKHKFQKEANCINRVSQIPKLFMEL